MCETEPGSGQFEKCTADFICESEKEGNPVNYYIDKDSINTLDNWVETLDLMCVPDKKI
jgi:predicted RNA-binding protein associated with RNAse of E/G family